MILFLILMQLKHFIIDFPLQGPYQYLNKGTYGHPGGVLHSGLHALVTWIILMFFTPWAFVIAAAEFVIHYHIDWAKVNITKKYKWSEHDPGGTYLLTTPPHLKVYSNNYFHSLGFDQLLHQLTYVAMTVLI